MCTKNRGGGWESRESEESGNIPNFGRMPRRRPSNSQVLFVLFLIVVYIYTTYIYRIYNTCTPYIDRHYMDAVFFD